MQADPIDITSTPQEKIKAQRNKAHQPNNIVDVVNEKIMLGTEQIVDVERFTTMVKMSDPNSSSATTTVFHRQNSNSSYSSSFSGATGGFGGNVTGSRQQLINTNTSVRSSNPLTLDSVTAASMLGGYSNINTTKVYNQLGSSVVAGHSSISQQRPTLRDIGPPMGFQQPLKSSSNLADHSSSSSMLHQLLNPDSDHLIIQELESLLGKFESLQGRRVRVSVD